MLAEARTEAARLSETGTTNLYDLRMIAWVYLDSIKHETSSLPQALPYLRLLLDLPLDSSDTILWEQLYWRLAKILFGVSVSLSTSAMEEWKGCWDGLPKVPGKAYSVLLKALLSQAMALPNLTTWLDAWGWENLQSEDFVAEKSASGKEFPALAERAYLAAAKAYLSHPATGEALTCFLARLDGVSEVHPQLLYLLYYRVQLRLKTGQLADALSILLPFARQKQRDFWVWDLIADLYPGQPEPQLACYAKALTCHAKPEFLVKLRQKYARLLVQEGRWAEAKAEIEEVIRVRVSHQWRIPTEIADWVHAQGYDQIKAGTINATTYAPTAARAEHLLYDPQAGVVGVVSGINEQKRTAQFVVSEEVTGGFGYASLGFVPAVGDCLLLHLEQRTASDGTTYPKVLHARPIPTGATSLLRAVRGPFKRLGTVGFVGNALVEAPIASHLLDNLTYDVQTVKSYNAKRQTWGWKVFKVIT